MEFRLLGRSSIQPRVPCQAWDNLSKGGWILQVRIQLAGFRARLCRVAITGEGLYQFGMPPVTLKAHFDGKHIVLDEPFELPQNAQLAVTLLASEMQESERKSWTQMGAEGLARAYGSSEPEYSAADLKK
jgi:hypothetical protein